MNFKLKAPCEACPWRLDNPPFVRYQRMVEIIKCISNDGSFPCHKTLDYNVPETEEKEMFKQPQAHFCGGALIFMQKNDLILANVVTRLGVMFKRLDPDKLYTDADVITSTALLKRHYGIKDEPDGNLVTDKSRS